MWGGLAHCDWGCPWAAIHGLNKKASWASHGKQGSKQNSFMLLLQFLLPGSCLEFLSHLPFMRDCKAKATLSSPSCFCHGIYSRSRNLTRTEDRCHKMCLWWVIKCKSKDSKYGSERVARRCLRRVRPWPCRHLGLCHFHTAFPGLSGGKASGWEAKWKKNGKKWNQEGGIATLFKWDRSHL